MSNLICSVPSNQKNKHQLLQDRHPVSLPVCTEAQFIFSRRCVPAATRLQRQTSWIHLGELGQQLKSWIKSDCILCPEEALPAILRGLINMAAVGCAERCHGQLKNYGDIINLNVLYLEWRRFYNHYCDGPQAASCAKGKGWMKITLFLTRPLCVFWSATTCGKSEQLDFINWVLAAFCSGGRGESHWWDWSLSPWYHLPTVTTNNYSLKSITRGQSSSPISSKVQLLAPRLYSCLPADEGLAHRLPSKLHIANSGVCMCGRVSFLRWVIKQRYILVSLGHSDRAV